jgi:hypothetical protein
MASRGDRFDKGGGVNKTLVNPEEPRWSERILYYLQYLTGQDTDPKNQYVIATKSDAIGAISDEPANPSNLSSASLISLTKAIVQLNQAIEQSIDAMASAVDADLDAILIVLNSIDAELSELHQDAVFYWDAINQSILSVLQLLEQTSVGTELDGVGAVILPIAVPVSWVSWGCDDFTASCGLVIESGGTVVMRSFSPGFSSFPKALVCDKAIVTSSNPAAIVSVSFGG